jgi:hypothetical protein
MNDSAGERELGAANATVGRARAKLAGCWAAGYGRQKVGRAEGRTALHQLEQTQRERIQAYPGFYICLLPAVRHTA